MTFEWSIPIGSILIWFAQSAVMLLVSFYGVQRAIDKKFADLDLKLANVDLLMTAFKGEIKSDIRDLTGRISALETGQDEWTKTLRARTHDLAEKLNEMVLKVDRLERPGKGN
jgi:hypothetical protein